MKIKILLPIISDIFNEEVVIEAQQFVSPDTEIIVQNLDKGTASIESVYDEMLGSPDIVTKVIQAEKDGFDGVFVDCFGDPGVEAAREMVSIPVVGGFQPAALLATMLGGYWSVVSVLPSVVPMIRNLARKLGVDGNVASIRHINTPVLELTDKKMLQDKLLEQLIIAHRDDGAEAIVLGCTGMMGLAKNLEAAAAEQGIPMQVVDPTGAALGFLELQVRNKISHSKITYAVPSEKERKV
ncbi:MAG: aspartate/glutamate racemase family protein [Spirochaetaceae bacterium]|nr:aspartate/glutamate racemase family protein [Spirochaetaceae bacterium]